MAYPENIDSCEDLPLLTELEVVDYDRIQAMITTSKEEICSCSETSIGLVSQDIRQIMLSIGDNITETTTLIQSHSGITIIA